MTKEEKLKWLEQHQSSTPSHWREKAEWERENRAWIRHSQFIAVIMLSRMDELHLTQTSLAERMGCSQQYVSRILKGRENLSLETIAKIEEALQISVISHPRRYNIEEDDSVNMAAEVPPFLSPASKQCSSNAVRGR